MAGILFGSVLRGMGEGGNKYIDLEEKRRAEEAANNQRFAVIDYTAGKQQDVADTADAKQRERKQAFQTEAESWRKENPDAPISKFVSHFATSEYSDLLAPTLQAANLISAEQRRALEEKLAMLRDRRDAAAADRANTGNDIANRRLNMQEQDYRDKQSEEQRKKGLLQGYLSSKTNSPSDAAAYRDTLIAEYGVDPAGKQTGAEATTVTTKYDDQGNETKTTTKGKETSPGVKPIAGANATTESYKGHTVWEKDGKFFFYDPARGGAAVRLEK
jgi:hypothetical protein